jgi:RNA polymerase sigma-70 factor (ECF subfamily)
MNIYLDRLRERKRRERREADWTDIAVDRYGPEAADDAPSPAAVADSRQRLQRLLAAIDTLPPGTARIFRRHKIDGLGHAQVAAEFGISRSAVEKHMAVALAHLRARLDP